MEEIRVVKTAQETREDKIKAWIDRAVALVAVLSALAAMISAYAAHRDAAAALEKQSDAIALEYRSYILPTVKNEYLMQASDGKLWFKVDLEVLGKTPVLDVDPIVICEARPSDKAKSTEELQQELDAQVVHELPAQFFPGTKHEDHCNPVTVQKDAIFMVYGRVNYKDYFDRAHISEFCYETIPSMHVPINACLGIMPTIK